MNRPECPLVVERLPALTCDDLPSGEAALVRAHLRGCAECALEAEAFAATVAAIGGEAAAVDPHDFDLARARLHASLRQPAAPRQPRRAAVRVATGLAAAAAVVLIVSHAPPIGFAQLRRASQSLVASVGDAGFRFQGFGSLLTSDTIGARR